MGCAQDPLTPDIPDPAASPRPPLTDVNLPLLEVRGEMRWATELRGLATMAVELGLSDLPGVVVRIPGAAPAPSAGLALPVARRHVDARFSATPLPGGPADDPLISFELELCVSGGACVTTISEGRRKNPWGALGGLLDGAADALALAPDEAVAAAWRRPGSPDPYAELLTGRAAATLYGLLPMPEDPMDKRENPLLRAVVLDPGQPLALWALARWEAATDVPDRTPVETLARASLTRPASSTFAADAAALLTAAGRVDAAAVAWEAVRTRAPEDPRFLEPTARALFAARRPADARTVMDTFPAEFAWHPQVAELRVAVTEAVDGPEGLDPLLVRWAETDPGAAAPVRRRVDIRVQAGAYDDALALLPSLRARAPGPEPDALEVALLVALGRLDQAAARAPAAVADRVAARAERARDPGAVLDTLPDPTEIAVVNAEALAWAGRPAEALPLAEVAIAARPSLAPAHAARARALEALGRTEDASEAWGRAWELDPALEGGPVEAGRVASTFRQIVRETPDGPLRSPRGPVP
jgi:tetratricopeptide (TPR) repeat protein